MLNKLHCSTQEELQEQEKWFSVSRIIELLENPVKESFDLKHLQEIHRYIFQDVYPWAGEINMIHPFREGNGRTQRVFLQFLAKEAVYLLDFKSLTVRQMENASIRSASVDNKGFYDI